MVASQISDNLFEIPDLFLLDVYISNVNGSNICKEIKAKEALKDIPVILVSADTNFAQLCAQCGANDYLEKPFKIMELLTKVEKYLQN